MIAHLCVLQQRRKIAMQFLMEAIEQALLTAKFRLRVPQWT
jgi:hypothetical protein